MKRLLVTGASGFIGNYITLLARDKWDVWGTYHHYVQVQGHVSPIHLDLRHLSSIEDCLDKARPDVIIHAAAISQVDYCEAQQDLAYQVNTVATQMLAGLASKRRIRLIFLSSDMVFDGFKGHYAEHDRTAPLNYYGQTKIDAEEDVLKFCSNAVVARCALVYGRSLTENPSMLDLIRKRIENRESMNLFVDQYRTPIYVEDLAHALLELCSDNFFGTLHLGGPECVSRFHLAEIFAKINRLSQDFFNPISVKKVSEMKNRPKDACMDCTLAQKTLKTKLRSVEDGMRAYRAMEDLY